MGSLHCGWFLIMRLVHPSPERDLAEHVAASDIAASESSFGVSGGYFYWCEERRRRTKVLKTELTQQITQSHNTTYHAQLPLNTALQCVV